MEGNECVFFAIDFWKIIISETIKLRFIASYVQQ
jgi:hypothetical protein